MSLTGQLAPTGQMSRSLCLIRNLCKRLASHVLGDGTRLGEGKEEREQQERRALKQVFRITHGYHN